MAIIEPLNASNPVDDFIGALERAARGVLLVSDAEGQPMSTAWLITDTLAIIPDYVASGATKFKCWSARGPKRPIATDLLPNRPGQPPATLPALLRLRKPLKGRALSLRKRRLKKGEAVFIVHHPNGTPQALVSVGRLQTEPTKTLQYDANTDRGSSGAPVLDMIGRVVGMHTRGIPGMYNEGLALITLLDGLRSLQAWPEIAEHHQLIDPAEALSLERIVDPDSDIVTAAVRWSLDRNALPVEARNRLKPLVIDPTANRWILRAEERQSILDTRSLPELKRARGNTPAAEPGQRVIDRILSGPPYSLADLEEGDLPYWLQAVRWFSQAVPNLPAPAQINRELQQRRVRSRLRRMAEDFRGRADELAELQKWYNSERPGPMVVTGPGGVGKSALISRFAELLPDDTPLFWLDFDRADLSPDKAESVLVELYQQAALQLDGVPSTPDTGAPWIANALAFGEQFTRAAAGRGSPLLVLDGFEVAQRVKRHEEIWRLVRLIQEKAPALRVLVAGRAPVGSGELIPTDASFIRLTGMRRADAATWLRDTGLRDDAVLQRVLDISHCLPLSIKYAVRLMDKGGKIEELPEQLPHRLVEGVLYRRVLDRVIDPDLNEIARDVLVLRRLTIDMMPVVLEERLPRDADLDEVFERLSHELALVENEPLTQTTLATLTVLRLRPEVRSATLRLLELDDAARVRRVDEKAAAWYADQDGEDLVNAAELVYHRLRLNDVEGAAQAWRTGCSWRLTFAEDDLAEDAHEARHWLRTHIEKDQVRPVSLGDWEKSALLNIHSALDRGVLQAIPEILAGRTERGPTSPLLLYDAWARLYAGDMAGARALLAGAAPDTGAVGRDRTILAALLAVRADDRPEADRLLQSVQDESRWSDWPDPPRYALAVQAARVRLTVDLYIELALAELLDRDPATRGPAPGHGPFWEQLRSILSPIDVKLPSLVRRLSQPDIGFEALSAGWTIPIPKDPSGLPTFQHQLNEMRLSSLDTSSVQPVTLPLEPDLLTDPADVWRIEDGSVFPITGDTTDSRAVNLLQLGLATAILAWRRWRLVSQIPFLARCCELAEKGEESESLFQSIIGTLGIFRSGEPAVLTLFYQSSTSSTMLDAIIDRTLSQAPSTLLSPGFECASLALRVLRRESSSLATSSTPEAYPSSDAVGPLLQWLKQTTASQPSSGQPISNLFPNFILELIQPADLRALLRYLLRPDPLEVLARRVLGYPDSLLL